MSTKRQPQTITESGLTPPVRVPKTPAPAPAAPAATATEPKPEPAPEKAVAPKSTK